MSNDLIKINIDDVEKVKTKIGRESGDMQYVQNSIRGVGFNIDGKIQARKNLNSRITKAYKDAIELEKQIRKLETSIGKCANFYSEADNKAKGKNDWTQLMRNAVIGMGAALLDPRTLLRAGKGLRFKMVKRNGKIFFEIAGANKNTDYTRLLKKYLGNEAQWLNPKTAKRLLKDGIAIFDMDKGKHYSRTIERYASSKFKDLNEFIGDLGQSKMKVAGKRMATTALDEVKVWDDFLGWKNASEITKAGKAAGIVGLGVGVYDNFMDNFYSKETGKWKFEGKRVEFLVDTGVDIGMGAGAMGFGAAVGSFFLPPVGTVVGATVGVTTNAVMNMKFEFGGPPAKSLVDVTKDGANKVINAGMDKVKKFGIPFKEAFNDIGRNLKFGW